MVLVSFGIGRKLRPIFSFGFGIGPKPKTWFRSYTKSELHFSDVTSYKIYTLVSVAFIVMKTLIYEIALQIIVIF